MPLPIPQPNANSRPYWEAAQTGRLLIQSCTQCGQIQAVPRGLCGHCHGDALEWQESSRKGSIVAVSTVHRAPNADFRDAAPYVLALVELAEGSRLMLNVIGKGRMEAAIGDAVEIVFEPRGDTAFQMPQAKRRLADADL